MNLRLVDDDKYNLLTLKSQLWKNLVFIFFFVFWGISPSRRSPGSYAVGRDPTIFLCSCVPMEIFFRWDGSGKFKNTRRKGTDQENSKQQEGKNGGRKKKRFLQLGGSHTCVFSIDREHPLATSLRRTHSYGNLPHNIISLRYKNVGCEWWLMINVAQFFTFIGNLWFWEIDQNCLGSGCCPDFEM